MYFLGKAYKARPAMRSQGIACAVIMVVLFAASVLFGQKLEPMIGLSYPVIVIGSMWAGILLASAHHLHAFLVVRDLERKFGIRDVL